MCPKGINLGAQCTYIYIYVYTHTEICYRTLPSMCSNMVLDPKPYFQSCYHGKTLPTVSLNPKRPTGTVHNSTLSGLRSSPVTVESGLGKPEEHPWPGPSCAGERKNVEAILVTLGHPASPPDQDPMAIIGLFYSELKTLNPEP